MMFQVKDLDSLKEAIKLCDDQDRIELQLVTDNNRSIKFKFRIHEKELIFYHFIEDLP